MVLPETFGGFVSSEQQAIDCFQYHLTWYSDDGYKSGRSLFCRILQFILTVFPVGSAWKPFVIP